MVVYKIARFFLKGFYAQCDKVTQIGILEVTVVQCLVGVGNFFIINSFTYCGVVLYFYGKCSAYGFYKYFILNRYVGVLAVTLHIACGFLPAEIVLTRKLVFMVAPVIYIG